MDSIYIQKLQGASNLNEANAILNKLHANGAVKKLVEISFMTRNSKDISTQEYGMTCFNEAITTLKDSEQPTPKESPGLKVKGNHFVQEEEVSNHNSSQRAAGSEQSTDIDGLPMEGTQDGDEDMEHAPDTENQMKEMKDGDNPMDILEQTGLHPDIAKGMGAKMPQIPPMGSGDQVKQMKYTIQKYHETVIKPLMKYLKVHDKAIRELSHQIRETKLTSLDLPSMKENSIASFRETNSPLGEHSNWSQPVSNKVYDIVAQRSRMTQLNDSLAQQLT